MRYLYTADGNELFAYAPGRRDFFRASDDTLWAHESHEWLVAAISGEPFAHRTGDVYYGAASGERLYREAREPTGNAGTGVRRLAADGGVDQRDPGKHDHRAQIGLATSV